MGKKRKLSQLELVILVYLNHLYNLGRVGKTSKCHSPGVKSHHQASASILHGGIFRVVSSFGLSVMCGGAVCGFS